ncbi:chaplin [Streptomyces sp. NPDC093225]|uniref:chaplin n=1 Tax=Streptomyces sp. NPDC093225 TaxID=3366034 RepID=UPI0037F369FE
MIATIVAGGAATVAGITGAAYADAGAAGHGAGSPGLVSGNLVQLPVHVPVNVCGNTVSVVGLLNPAAGNACANGARPGAGHGSAAAAGQGVKPGTSHTGSARTGTVTSGGGAHAQGSGKDSPGLLSGNGIQLPVDVPVNISGNSVNVVGVGNASHDNTSVNGPGPHSGLKPPQPTAPVVRPPAPRPPAPVAVARPAGPGLAHTGTDALGYLAPAGAGLLLGGALLYRRFRATS